MDPIVGGITIALCLTVLAVTGIDTLIERHEATRSRQAFRRRYDAVINACTVQPTDGSRTYVLHRSGRVTELTPDDQAWLDQAHRHRSYDAAARYCAGCRTGADDDTPVEWPCPYADSAYSALIRPRPDTQTLDWRSRPC